MAVAAPLALVLLTTVVRREYAPGAAPAFSIAVAVAALYGGWRPGLLAMVLSAAGYAFFPDALAGPAGVARAVQFAVVSIALVWMGGAAFRQRWLAVAQAEENARLRRVAEGEARRAEASIQEAAQALTARAETERSLASAERVRSDLYEATARYAAIVASSSDAIISKTLDGTITSWNPAAEHIFGYTAAEMVGSSIYRLIPEELHDAERDVLARLSRGEQVSATEAERLRKDGRRIWIALSSSPVRDDTGRIVGAASIKRDVTESRMAEERLRETQRLRAIGQLAGGIAHEANNQMLVVLGAAHFLLKQPGLSDGATADVRAIIQAAERTAGITQQLLAFGRRQTLRLESHELDPVVAEFQPILRRSLSEQHELSLDLGAPRAVALVDARQLEQVLLNLTLNARDAMPDGGQLTIATRLVRQPDDHEYICLTVADTGSGMDPATLERVFEPFFTTKDVGQGSGLGLSVVEGIVSQSGGFVRVVSAPGEGTTFSLFFPSAAAPASSEAAVVGEGPGTPSGAGRSVLLVEDERSVRELASRILVEEGYTVHQAANGREAMDLLRQLPRRVDLVITDLGMPVMDGHALARRLSGEWPGVPVLYISGYADTGGVSPLIQKPFAPDELVRQVSQLMEGENGKELGAGALTDLGATSAE